MVTVIFKIDELQNHKNMVTRYRKRGNDTVMTLSKKAYSIAADLVNPGA